MSLNPPPGVTIPPLPGEATPDQRLAHASLLLRVAEYEQRERNIAASNRLALAQERIADTLPQQIALLQQLVDQPASSGEGVTAGDVAIVKGLAEAIRTA